MSSINCKVEKRKIVVGFVLFKAEPSLLDRILLALNNGFECYVFDNSPSESYFRESVNTISNCVYITSGKNVGLGFGIASICAQAYYNGLPAMIFFDQDTIFDITTLEFIEKFYIQNKNLETQYSSLIFKATDKASYDKNKPVIKDVLLSISSGSLFFLQRLKEMNWHNQTYFVDCVDYEFCLNTNNNNLKIGEVSNTPGFDHISEQADLQYNIFGKWRMMRKYSTIRIKDTLKGSIRIFFTSIKTLNFTFAYSIMRSLSIYLYFQFLVRIRNTFNRK